MKKLRCVGKSKRNVIKMGSVRKNERIVRKTRSVRKSERSLTKSEKFDKKWNMWEKVREDWDVRDKSMRSVRTS